MYCKENAEVEAARRGECRSQKLESKFIFEQMADPEGQANTIKPIP